MVGDLADGWLVVTKKLEIFDKVGIALRKILGSKSIQKDFPKDEAHQKISI